MSKPVRIIDSAMFLIENFTPQQIDSLRRHNIINNRVVLALEAKKVYDKYYGEKKMARYTCVAAEMNISVQYVIQLLKY